MSRRPSYHETHPDVSACAHTARPCLLGQTQQRCFVRLCRSEPGEGQGRDANCAWCSVRQDSQLMASRRMQAASQQQLLDSSSRSKVLLAPRAGHYARMLHRASDDLTSSKRVSRCSRLNTIQSTTTVQCLDSPSQRTQKAT